MERADSVPVIIGCCDYCGNGMYSDDIHFRRNDKCYCRDCAEKHCAVILVISGGKLDSCENAVCDFCKRGFQGKHIAFEGRKFCLDCVCNHGEELAEKEFCKFGPSKG